MRSRLPIIPFAPLAAELDAVVDPQAGGRDRRIRTRTVGARGNDSHRPPQPLGLSWLESVVPNV
jgi:hypothetical protein